MAIRTLIKDNIGKVAFGSIGTIVTIVTALFTIDARYAHAVDVIKEKLQTQDLIQDTSQTLRRQMLEDKLFELDVKKAQSKEQKLPPIESALKERYERQLSEISRSQNRNRSANSLLPRD